MLGPLLTAFPTAADGETALAKIAVYAMAAEDIPPWATRQAMKDFIKGNVPEHDGRFLPTPAQLAKRAKSIRDQKSADEYKRLAREKASKPDPEPMTEQERERRAAQVKALMAGFSG